MIPGQVEDADTADRDRVVTRHDDTLADRDLRVATDDAYAMTRRLAAEEGLLVGISSGASLVGAMKMLHDDGRSAAFSQAPSPRVVVVIFPDGGERYLSESFWSEAD